MRAVVLALLLCTATGATADLAPVVGSCDVLDTELTDASAHLFVTDVGVIACEFVGDGLSAGGQEILADDNAGGSSLYSEILAHEFLLQCEQAVLLKTETEILYTDPNGKKTDLLLEIDGEKIGVSVTRAIVFPPDTPLSPTRALEQLEDKLGDVILANANVRPEDAWAKQILVVETPSESDRDVLLDVIPTIDAALRADTVLWVVQTDGQDEFLYFGPDPVCEPIDSPRLLSFDARIYPNPFNPMTTVAIITTRPSVVSVVIHDTRGRTVRTLAVGRLVESRAALRWDGRNDDGARVASGVYTVRVRVGREVVTRRIVLVE